MTGLMEMKEKGYIPQKLQIKLMIGGALSLTKTLLTTLPSNFRRLRAIDHAKEKYIRPVRAYDIPKYHDGMKFCSSDEKYLRPTLYCNPRAPEVIALANHLGAFKKTDYEFTKAAFHHVKEKMTLEILPFNPVEETFRRGTGTCFHLITAFIALCRAAGVKARYKIFAMNMIQAWYDAVVDVDPLIKKWYDSMGYFMLEGEGEAYIDGKWVVAHVGPKAERQAAAGIPITKFGEDSLGNWFTMVPGTLMKMESIAYGLGGSTKVLRKLAPGSMERVNISVLKQIEKGKEIIKKAGGLEAYDHQARLKKGPASPKINLQHKKEIIFEG
ncbi:MAG: transglutaminase domain-containing protein [Candidatus Thermoplasmatota archaeon]|nr:transglutaminase domain-containing protein [Candidatus Thermoplasmatota archaeon]